MSLGRSDTGSLKCCKSENDVRQALIKACYHPINTIPYFEFLNAEEGDVVAAYHNKFILGLGRIKGCYYFADKPIRESKRHLHRRTVEWKPNSQINLRKLPPIKLHMLSLRKAFFEIKDTYLIKIINTKLRAKT